MWIAETAGKAALVAAALATSTLIAASQPPEQVAPPPRAPHVGLCTQVAKRSMQPEYRDVLLRAWSKLHPCLAGEPDPQLELALDVTVGHVSYLDVRSTNGQLVSTELVRCVRDAVSPLQFMPAVDRTVQLTLRLR